MMDVVWCGEEIYNDMILNDELVDYDHEHKGEQEQLGTLSNANDVPMWDPSKREYEARQAFAAILINQMKEERVNILNTYHNQTNLITSIQDEVENHYQVIKRLRTKQWRLDKEMTASTTSPWWALRSVAAHVHKEEMRQLDTILDRSFMLLLGRCLQVNLFG